MSDAGHASPSELSPARSEAGRRKAPLMSDAGSLRGTETVLVVEDERPVLELILDVMRLQGYTVLDAPEGDEALRVAQRHPGPIHLIIVDAVMPGLPAPDIVARLRATHPGLKELYVSGYTGDLIGQHGLLDVGPNFLQKPFTVDALISKVREVLDAG